MKFVYTALLGAVLVWFPRMELRATETANAYVVVRSSTYGVEGIIPKGPDFCVTTRGVGRPFFRADIRFRASRPYYLVEPSSGRMSLGIGESDGYRVRDESGNEDAFSGSVWVLKLDVEPTEVNVSCRSSSCTLKLTDDSFPGGRAVWTSCPEGIGGRGNSITFNPSALEPGEYRVTARSGFVPSYADSCVVRIVKIELITPSGDPVWSPVDSGDGQNEFTFSTAAPGVLTMRLKAKVTPSSAVSAVTDCRFGVGNVGASVKEWAAENPNGKAVPDGGSLTATVTFTGLPNNNSDFGRKKATVTWAGDIHDSRDYEVFFPRDSHNKVASMPNWFYYWKSLVSGDLVYSGSSCSDVMAEVRGMTRWSYITPPDKTHIYVYDEAICEAQSYGFGEVMSGIDMFVGTVIHEKKHLQQINRADLLVASSGNDCFRHGWSWNQILHNHWGKGQDGKWGMGGVDDDDNGIVDDAKALPPFEPGHGDDVALDHPQYHHWPSAWPLPIPLYPGVHPIECEAVNATDNAMDEHDYVGKDWASPGKQHQTMLDWRD